MANIFEDDSIHLEHTANLLNKGIIDGDVDQSDNSSTAIGSRSSSRCWGFPVWSVSVSAGSMSRAR